MKILILKFWFVACTIFCLYSLSTLVEERREVAIVAADRNKTDPIIILVCTALSHNKINRTEIRLEELREGLLNYFNRSEYPSNHSSVYSSTKKLVLNGLETGRYLIFKGMLCIILNDKREGFFISYLILPGSVYFAFKNSTLDFAPMTSLSTAFDQLIVQKRGPPYSNCTEGSSRLRYLNDCFKKKFRLSRYLYEGNETGPIHLTPTMNQTIEESEKSCLQKFWRENCEVVQFIPIPKSKKRKPVTTILDAQPKLSEFYFWVQFIGLVCSFVNISLNQLVSLVIQFASSRVKRRKVRIGLICLKWTIFFLSLTYCGYLYTSMFLGYKADERNPARKEITRNLNKQKIVRLAICVNIEEYFISEEDFYDLDALFGGFNLNDLDKTMSEIEKSTDGALDDHLESIHLNYQERMFRVDYIHEPKVLFRYIYSLYRCFILIIRPDYQAMPSNPKLAIRFKKIDSNLKLYLLTENENLNEDTFEYSPRGAFMKRVVRRLKSSEGCVNYRERYKNCTSRLHCIESCINKEALQKFKKIIIHNGVVDKDQFSPEEWSTINPITIPKIGPNRSIYVNLTSHCFEKFRNQRSCVEVIFNETIEIVPNDPEIKEIDLLLDVDLSIEELSWFNLLLNIMNIQSIFFGMNIFKLLRMLYSFIKPKLRMKLRNDKIALFLIYLLCSIGFTWHTYRIFDMTINEELTYSPDYEVVIRVRMPVVLFCLPIDEKLIDRNHQLTGRYLEQQTSEVTAESLFKSIIYLNETNDWIIFNLSHVERFFFLHLKCFRITIYREYDRRHFHFSINIPILKVNFADTFLNENRSKTVFFMTKTDETIEFSNVLNLFYDFKKYGFSLKRYSAEQDQLTVTYKDHLSLIKRFFSTSYEDDFNDLDAQLPDLKSSEFRFRTLKVPVEKEDFDFELRDDLLDQLFVKIKAETILNLLNNLDYQQTFMFNQLKRDDYSSSHFTFSLSLIKKTQSAKNEAKLILGLLNVLFWFDLGILDMHPIFAYFHGYLLIWLPIYLLNKLTQFLVFSHRWLKKFEQPLYKRLHSRKRRLKPTARIVAFLSRP